MSGVAYDTGALFAGDKNDRAMWALHEALLEEGVEIVVPATVLAEAWRGGGRQVNLIRMLRGCDIDWLHEERAKAVGALCGLSGHDDLADVHLAELAARRKHFAVFTSNRDHIERVLGVTGWAPTIKDV